MTNAMSPQALISRARQQAQNQREHIFAALQSLADFSLEQTFDFLCNHTGLPAMSLAALEALTPDFSCISYGDCLKQQCLLLKQNEGRPLFIVGDPLDAGLQTWACYRILGEFAVAFTHPLELKTLLGRLEGHQEALTQLIRLEQNNSTAGAAEEISLASIVQDESQVIRLVNSTLYDAKKSGASDIHLENGAHGLVIKYRIDGVLSTTRQLPDLTLAEQVISRLKVMAELDIGEKRKPQDGRFAVSINGREIDFRVSIMPGLFGEDAVLRILDKETLTAEMASLSLDSLGFDANTRQTIRRLALQPYGMLLVTGPTGSGKTTSLYATLSEINHGDDKIITIEDPVEYKLSGVLQIPVNERKGLTFAVGLRSILRHDPDKILVGEIRDRDTAEIAVQAALTGHLVFTSVHANNVFDVISRFHHMGLDTYSFVTALNGIVAQRLVRIVCAHCAEPVTPDAQLLADSGLAGRPLGEYRFMQGRGCAHCRGSGYRGRRALAEVLVLNDGIRELILQQAPLSQLKEKARQQGTCFMREQALLAVKAGHTTLQEINRVTFVE